MRVLHGWWPALGALLAGAASLAAPQLPDAAALPLLARLDRVATPIVLRGTLGPGRAHRTRQEAVRVIDDVQRRFLRAASATAAHAPVDLCLFESEASYTAFALLACAPATDCSPLGFYQPGRRLIVANLGRSIGNLRHELAHALIGDDFPQIPAWLNEGIGALYGTARFDGTGFRFAVNYRLRDVKAALAAGTLPTLDQLARSTAADVYGPRAMVYYGLARHVLLFLEQQGRLSDFYRAMRDDARTVDAQVALLLASVDERAFLGWVQNPH